MRALIIALALLQSPQHRLFMQPNLPSSTAQPPLFFEFAPASGTGMGAACACTTPTGSKGEVMTFTRASSGTCLKGNTTTGIANGDMVTCSTNQPRVMPGGDGTGALGLLVEGSRTNFVLRSQEFDNAAWSVAGGGVAAPTRTADQAVAPDGTTTADRVQIPATTAVQHSYSFQAINLAGVGSAGVFVKGNAQSGTFDLCLFNNGASAYVCTACSYVTTSWTLCKTENVPTGAINATYLFGNASDVNGGIARGAQDMFLWGAQWETQGAAFLSSYIATTSAAVTRAAETATLPGLASVASIGSGAATIVLPGLTGGTQGTLHMGANGALLYYVNSNTTVRAFDGTVETSRSTTLTTTPHRYATSWTGATLTVFDVTAGTSTSGAFDGTMETTNVCLGSGAGAVACGAGGFLEGVVKQVCVDPNPQRCR